ncbi:hypothetical protein E5K00_01425 [Hymenobacter aquaticus]|uniref:Lipocalin-like domain-containing protein n=1 Tax=Hymenobacter aquaticus TaxID=1867101 RepID=A0A4Z0Q2T4_9BACT|nr:hypothetical protein [Hymenobacter aquaticus]TGE23904.1 hypothetical protein E5K00_01425 [Hymenobacter aquaticus]
MNYLLLSLAGLLALPALGQKKHVPARKPVHATPVRPVPVAGPQPILVSLAMLQGKWQSVDDKREFWIVKGTELTMRYVTSGTSTDDDVLRLQVTDTCAATCATLAAHTVAKGDYLAVVDVACSAPLCYSVVDVSAAALTLSYTARGNTLRFRRVKEAVEPKLRLP